MALKGSDQFIAPRGNAPSVTVGHRMQPSKLVCNLVDGFCQCCKLSHGRVHLGEGVVRAALWRRVSRASMVAAVLVPCSSCNLTH